MIPRPYTCEVAAILDNTDAVVVRAQVLPECLRLTVGLNLAAVGQTVPMPGYDYVRTASGEWFPSTPVPALVAFADFAVHYGDTMDPPDATD